MFIHHKFQIESADQFLPSQFPQLEISLGQIMAQLAEGPAGPKAEMILSFVKNHSINSQQVKDFPELAHLISSQFAPLHVMENLFEASRQNKVFTKQLEDYVKEYLNS
jgi:hypothetical protein